MGSDLCHTISFSTAAVILAQLLTSYAINTQDLSYRVALVNSFILLIFFSSIWLIYLSGMNSLSGFKLSEFVTARPRCCHFITLSSLIPLQYFYCSSCVTFSILVFPSFLNLMTYLYLYMLRPVGIFLVFYTFLQYLRLVMQASVNNTIEETNSTYIFDFTGKAL